MKPEEIGPVIIYARWGCSRCVERFQAFLDDLALLQIVPGKKPFEEMPKMLKEKYPNGPLVVWSGGRYGNAVEFWKWLKLKLSKEEMTMLIENRRKKRSV